MKETFKMFALLTWAVIPFILIAAVLTVILSSCSPAGIRLTEEVVEEVAEEELKRNEDEK